MVSCLDLLEHYPKNLGDLEASVLKSSQIRTSAKLAALAVRVLAIHHGMPQLRLLRPTQPIPTK